MCTLNPFSALKNLGQGPETPPPATPPPMPAPTAVPKKDSSGTQTKARSRKDPAKSLRIKREPKERKKDAGVGVNSSINS